MLNTYEKKSSLGKSNYGLLIRMMHFCYSDKCNFSSLFNATLNHLLFTHNISSSMEYSWETVKHHRMCNVLPSGLNILLKGQTQKCRSLSCQPRSQVKSNRTKPCFMNSCLLWTGFFVPMESSDISSYISTLNTRHCLILTNNWQ